MSTKNPDQHAENADVNLSDADAFQQVYERHHLAVFRYIYGLCGGSLEDVEDLTTTTFLRAWKSRRRFQGDMDAALGWLLRIGRNLVIDNHRRMKRRGVPLDIETLPIQSGERLPEAQVSMDERIIILRDLMNKLPNEHKEIIVLRYLLGWRVKDIALHLDVSENLISVTIRRILKRLQDSWPES